MKYKDFIENNFLIDDAVSSKLVPFKFRPVQDRYYEQLKKDYSEDNNFQGLRELILKARKEGFTSMILAIFAASMLLDDNPVRFLEISYKEDATTQHYRRIKKFIISAYQKLFNIVDEKELEKRAFKYVKEGTELVLNKNGASFYVGTASVKVGERGGTVQGVLFSEAAWYPDTDKMTAAEVIEGTRNMVAVGTGMIFMESTANSYNYFHNVWQQATNKVVDYKPRFFSWRDFYSEEEFEIIKQGFTKKELIPQEYPDNPEEAFISTGNPVFSISSLKWYREQKTMIKDPIKIGNLVGVKEPIFENNENGFIKLFKYPEKGRTYVIGADCSEGKTPGDFSCAQVFDKTTWEQMAVWHGKVEPDVFAKELYKLGMVYNEAWIAPEKNSLGIAVVISLRDTFYQNIWAVEKIGAFTDKTTKELGWITDKKSKAVMIGDTQEAIRNKHMILHDKDTLQELLSYHYNQQGQANAVSGAYDDRVIALMIALQLVKKAPLSMSTQQNMLASYESSDDMLIQGQGIESYF